MSRRTLAVLATAAAAGAGLYRLLCPPGSRPAARLVLQPAPSPPAHEVPVGHPARRGGCPDAITVSPNGSLTEVYL